MLAVSACAERVEDIVLRYFEDTKLNILSVSGLNEAVTKYILAGDNDAPVYLIDCQVKKTLEKLRELKPDVDDVKDCIISLRDQREGADKEAEEARRILNASNRPRTTKGPANDDDLISDDDDVSIVSVHKTSTSVSDRPARGPGSRGGRGARGGRGSRRAQGRATTS